jgi:hypothetical protein
MTTRVVAIVVALLAALFGLAALGYALRAQAPVAAPTPAAVLPQAALAADPLIDAGAAAWQRHCARCHEAAEFTPKLAATDGPAVAGQMLEKLDGHGRADFADDLAILHWLATRPAEAAPPAPPDAQPEEAEDDFSL